MTWNTENFTFKIYNVLGECYLNDWKSVGTSEDDGGKEKSLDVKKKSLKQSSLEGLKPLYDSRKATVLAHFRSDPSPPPH